MIFYRFLAALLLAVAVPAVALGQPQTSVQSVSGVNPVNCSSTITTGGTAQNAIVADRNVKGFIIANIDTTEVMWISFTGTATAGTEGSYPLAPATATTFAGLSSFASPLGFGIFSNLSVVAATTGHKFSCTRW